MIEAARSQDTHLVGEAIVFHQLRPDDMLSIVDIMEARVDGRLRDKDMGLRLTESARRYLAGKGFDPADVASAHLVM